MIQKIKEWSVPQRLTGNIFYFGSPGSGKTCKQLTIAQGFKEHGWKIWDLFGGKREEGPFWAFPSDDKKIWSEIEAETSEFKVPGPKQYKVKLFYPMFSKRLPKRLPFNLPNVEPIVFQIPFRDPELVDEMEQMISLVTGPLGSTSLRLWDKIISKTNKYTTGREIKELFIEKPKQKDDKLYDMFLKPAIENNLLSSEVSKLNVDWIAEAEDTESVVVLCLDFVPNKFRFFVMAYILKKIFYLVKHNKIHKKNLALFREASLFMKVVDSDKSKEEITQIFRNIISDVARYCRSGLFLSMDTQDSAEVKNLVEGSEDLLFISEMPSPKSREVTLDPLKQDKRITQAQISYIGWRMKTHEVCVVERGKKARILKRINPPRSRYWKSEYGDFFSLWRRKVNKWKDVKEFIQIVEEEQEKRNILKKLDKIEEEEKEKEKIKVEEPKEKIEVKKEIQFNSPKIKKEVKYKKYNGPKAEFD